MDDFQPPRANAQTLPAADVTAPSSSANMVYDTFPLRKPEEDLNDFKVEVFASTLRRCRAKLSVIKASSFPWHEIALALSTLAAGTYLGGLPAEIKLDTSLGRFFHTVLPAVALSAFVAYIFLRRLTVADPARAASDALDELTDPERTR